MAYKNQTSGSTVLAVMGGNSNSTVKPLLGLEFVHTGTSGESGSSNVRYITGYIRTFRTDVDITSGMAISRLIANVNIGGTPFSIYNDRAEGAATSSSKTITCYCDGSGSVWLNVSIDVMAISNTESYWYASRSSYYDNNGTGYTARNTDIKVGGMSFNTYAPQAVYHTVSFVNNLNDVCFSMSVQEGSTFTVPGDTYNGKNVYHTDNGDYSSTFTITGNSNGGNTNTRITATRYYTWTRNLIRWGCYDQEYSIGSIVGMGTSDVTFRAIYGDPVISNISYSNNTLANLSKPTHDNTGDAPATLTLEYENGSASTSQTFGDYSTYEFSKWSSTYDGSDTLTDATAFTEDTMVYAIWKVTNYTSSIDLPSPTKASTTGTGFTVILNANSGTVAPSTLQAHSITDFTFAGWFTENNVKVSNPYNPSSQTNHTLYAHYTSIGRIDSVELPLPVKNGHVHTGWSTDIAGSNKVSSPYTPTGNITLYANWEISSGMAGYVFTNGQWKQIVVSIQRDGKEYECTSPEL